MQGRQRIRANDEFLDKHDVPRAILCLWKTCDFIAENSNKPTE